MKEKIMKTRAALLANEQGLKMNGEVSAPPSQYFIKKIQKAKRLGEAIHAENCDSHAAANDPDVSQLQSTLKFTMRENKRLQLQRETLGSKGSAELGGILQTSKLQDTADAKSDFFKSGGMSGIGSKVS